MLPAASIFFFHLLFPFIRGGVYWMEILFLPKVWLGCCNSHLKSFTFYWNILFLIQTHPQWYKFSWTIFSFFKLLQNLTITAPPPFLKCIQKSEPSLNSLLALFLNIIWKLNSNQRHPAVSLIFLLSVKVHYYDCRLRMNMKVKNSS